jgi:hypothetical protein
MTMNLIKFQSIRTAFTIEDNHHPAIADGKIAQAYGA